MVTINEHSWYGKNIHIIRPDGRVLRGICAQLVLSNHSIRMVVQFKEKGVNKKKTYSPILLLSMQHFWQCRDIVSETECVDGDPSQLLPTLVLSDVALQLINIEQQKAIHWMIRQLSLLALIDIDNSISKQDM